MGISDRMTLLRRKGKLCLLQRSGLVSGISASIAPGIFSWHRAYLTYFERLIRKTIIDLGGPDNWALPYWNYSDASNPSVRFLPPAFVQPHRPDGSANPLFVPRNLDGLRRYQSTHWDRSRGQLFDIPKLHWCGIWRSPGIWGAENRFQSWRRIDRSSGMDTAWDRSQRCRQLDEFL